MKPGEIAHNVSRGAFYLSLEKIAALLSGVAYVALLSRWLGPTKYGIIVLATSFTGLATMFTGNFEVYLERYAAEFEARGLVRTLRRAHRMALALKLVLGMLVSIVLVAMSGLLAKQFGTPELATLIPLLAITIAFDGLSTTGRATLYGIQQFRWVSVLAILFHVLKTILVAALWGAREGLVALAVGLSALTVLQGIVLTAIPWWMMRRAEDRGSTAEAPAPRALLRSMMAYCAPLLGARVTFLSGQNLSKIVLGKLFSNTELGYFSLAFLIVERFVELAQVLSSSLLPSLTRLVANDERARLRSAFEQALRLITTAACALSFGLFVFPRELTVLVGSRLFEPTVPILRILALVPMLRTTQQPLTMLFQAMRRPGTVLALAVVKFVTEFGCYFLLVPTLALQGAGWANLAGAATSCVAAMILLARLLPEGAAARTRTSLKALALTSGLLLAGLAIERMFSGAASTVLRALLVPVGFAGVFALGLVNRYDLEKVSSVPLQSGWMRRLRDGVVGTARTLARAVEPRRVG
jgi:O-antigen/teichoic acid export membrane protein